MRFFASTLLATVISTTPIPASGQDACPEGKVCVDREDMSVILSALREKKCLVETPPTLTTDPITIVVDKQGRIYGSGSEPHPFKLKMQWCTYDITATGQTKIVAAQYIEPKYGFRFRPKATLGLLGTELLAGTSFHKAVDGGVLLEPFYFHFVNLNGYVGVRSAGAGLGFDLTKNFGIYAGYSVTWDGWRSNPFASAYFSFW